MIAKKLPIPVYAIQYKGSNRKEILDMIDKYDLDVQENKSGFSVRIKRGALRLDSGAWLAYGLKDKEVRVIQDEIFKETYNKARTQEPHLYTKKPVEAECIRIDEFNLVTVHHILEFIHDGKIDIDIYKVYQQAAKYQSDGFMPIHTLEGTVEAKIGDYLIRGPQGEVYPVLPSVFSQNYSVVKE